MGATLQVLLASPRGFCAGVVRAIDALDAALARFGPPVYVRHDIVHNPEVVERFRAAGAIFVEDLAEVPDGARLFLSAHGVGPAVRAEAAARRLRVVDTACPLVTKVHAEARRFAAQRRAVIVVGHRGHAEVEGTVGWIGDAPHHVVETAAEARALPIDPAASYGYVTQTTLSIDDTSEVIDVLRERLPGLAGPAGGDICYATTNRQMAVKAIAARAEAMLVVGGRHSSNSRRLVEAALRAGCRNAWLLERPSHFDPAALDGCATIGLTSGASTPEGSVQAVIARLRRRFEVTIEEIGPAEQVRFRAASLAPLA
jgi:4-hydroxy-3-methylbut-2-enyl diphosphate reductase